MKTDRELMQQALEALESRCGTNAEERGPEGAITALRERLAQPEQEPFAYSYLGIKANGEQHGPHLTWKPEYMDAMSASMGAVAVPLYTTPPQRKPEQEPNYWLGYGLQAHTEKPFEGATPLYTAPLQRNPEQEPVAWANKDDLQNFDMRVRTNCDLMHTVPLYTAPLQRQPLSDEEIDHIYTGIRAVHHEIDSYVFARAVEAKLKENT